MNRLHHAHHAFHLARQAAGLEGDANQSELQPIGQGGSASQTLELRTPDLTRRDASTSTSSCGDSGTCEKPYSSPTIAIVCATIIPIAIAIVVLIVLHRRHQQKLRLEDQHDPHKSLDFGLDGPGAGAKGRKGPKLPEMTLTEANQMTRRGRGLSMDMKSSPYLLPAEIHNSRESFHSMSRQDAHDPYRPVTFIKDDASMRSKSRNRGDGASDFTKSSDGTERMNANLLQNAQRMSRSYPPQVGAGLESQPSLPNLTPPEQVYDPIQRKASPASLAPIPTGTPSQLSPDGMKPPPAQRNIPKTSHQADMAELEQPQTVSEMEQPRSVSELPSAAAFPPRTHSKKASEPQHAAMGSHMSQESDYGDAFKITPPSPKREQPAAPANQAAYDYNYDFDQPEEDDNALNGLGLEGLGYDPRRLSMSVRPLPPDDPTEDPESRANRIRSFYKEYFDDSKKPAQNYDYGGYYEDYDQEYLQDGTVFDPASGNFVVAQRPYAAPVTRRAMTPPPRGPPRFRGTHASASSAGRSGSRGPMSPMSDGGRGRAPGPRKPLPPPKSLKSLPTPHLLKDDAAIFGAADFAPPISIRDLQNGRRPDSPLGSPRAYSPTVRAHTPLQSSFDDLAVIPSPHLLRKSGTFTSLDFAPPPRFRDIDTGSDAASIRSAGSGRSNLSKAQLHAIRTGAYRVSRIPQNVVNTPNLMLEELKPQWDMRGKA